MFLLMYFERKRVSLAEEGQRERGSERIPSRLRAVRTESDAGLELTNREIMTRAEIERWMLSWLNHPGAPPSFFCIIMSFKKLPLRIFIHSFIHSFIILNEPKDCQAKREWERHTMPSKMSLLIGESDYLPPKSPSSITALWCLMLLLGEKVHSAFYQLIPPGS